MQILRKKIIENGREAAVFEFFDEIVVGETSEIEFRDNLDTL